MCAASRIDPGLIAKLRDAAEILGPLERIAGAMFFVKDASYRYVAMSDAVREGIGLSAGDDPIGKTDFDFFPPLIAESYRRNDRQVIEDGRTLLDEVHVVVTRGGRVGLAYSSKWPLHDRTGSVIGLVGTNRRHESQRTAGGDDAGRLLPAVDRILHDYGRRLTIESLARECSLSASHFMRLFRITMRATPRQFLEKVRITQATDLLQSTRLPIAEIADRCGFYDHSSFVKRFRLHTGVTPLAYRKRRRQCVAEDLAAVVSDSPRRP